MLPLILGEVALADRHLETVVVDEPAQLFRAMLQNGAYDIAEMSLGQCFEQAASDAPPFVALPVFPSRMFRHGFIFTNRAAGISSPRDLAGKRIGVQHHGMSAAVWIRQMLRTMHDVDLGGVTWVEGGVNRPGALKVSGASRGRGLRIEGVVDRCLSDMLADGSIDALIGAWIPDSFGRSPDVTRLFADYRAIEKQYYAATGIFPIMHAMVIRADVHRNDPGLARSVFDACNAAKVLAMKRLRVTGELSTMLPWQQAEIEEIDATFGPNFWPYGLSANRVPLQAFADTLLAEGALDAPIALERVFLPLD